MNNYLAYRQKIKLEGKPPKENKVYKIPRESKKRARINREYAKESRPVWRGKPCEIRSPECTGMAECINHKKGKITMELLMNPNFWQPACFKCNNYIEQHHKWAVENGHKVSRI